MASSNPSGRGQQYDVAYPDSTLQYNKRTGVRGPGQHTVSALEGYLLPPQNNNGAPPAGSYQQQQQNLIGQAQEQGTSRSNDNLSPRPVWIEVPSDTLVPGVQRDGTNYLAIRIMNEWVLGGYLNVLPRLVYDCVQLDCYNMTQGEANVLNHTNSGHCDGYFGSAPFTPNDKMVKVSDALAFAQFVKAAYQILQHGGRKLDTVTDFCGFLNIRPLFPPDILIPYTILPGGERAVLLTQVSGEEKTSRIKSQPITGLPLAYIKLCCKMIGFPEALMSTTTMEVVKLWELKKIVPKNNTFDVNCWPDPKPGSLLPQQLMHNILDNGKNLIGCESWTKFQTYESSIASTNVAVASTSGASNGNTTIP